jgi:hypothetical protein
MSGAFGGPTSGASELNRIVDALQQMLKLQGLSYEQLVKGVAVLTTIPILTNAANDAAAAAAGIPIGGMYRNGSIMMQRIV